MVVSIHRYQGFSLVELTIVLAIAALIMILVFVGFRQATINRRDHARKADAARYLEAERMWVSDNNGLMPTSLTYDTASGIKAKYITSGGAKFADPDNNNWTIDWRDRGGTTTPQPGNHLLVGASSTCSGGAMIDGGSRQFAVIVVMQTGGTYCLSN